jgi:hypothetical protein
MSQENVELVRAVYAAPGLEAAMAFYAEDIEWDMSDRVFNPRVYRGHAGVREWRRELREVWGEWRNEPERFIDWPGERRRADREVGSGVDGSGGQDRPLATLPRPRRGPRSRRARGVVMTSFARPS